jgi:hypothetical protein
MKINLKYVRLHLWVPAFQFFFFSIVLMHIIVKNYHHSGIVLMLFVALFGHTCMYFREAH